MKIWIVEPDFIDYDLYKAAVVVASTKDEAERIAVSQLTDNDWVKDNYVEEFRQNWSAKPVLEHPGIVLADFNAG